MKHHNQVDEGYRIHIDNRIFNVNGQGDEMLKDALRLVFAHAGMRTCKAWSFDQKCGLLLHWYSSEEGKPKTTDFPAVLTADECCPFVLAWLRGDQAATVEMIDWDSNMDHDGHNSMGWRVFCEKWGHVCGLHSVICAVKPAYMWHGK